MRHRTTVVGVGSGKGPFLSQQCPLTYKDGTALALSCMADYGAPAFPFLAVGATKVAPDPPQEASEGTYGTGVMDRRMGVAMGMSCCLGVAWSVEGSWGRQTLPILHPFSVTYCIFRQPCSGSLVLCLNHSFCL